MKKINIAVDGTAGSGKSSTMEEVSKILKYNFIDTGLMYRAFTFFCIENNSDFSIKSLKDLILKFNCEFKNGKIFMNGEDVGSKLTSSDILNNIGKITVVDFIRERMVFLQRELAKEKGNILVGRDIGTIVLPQAELKLYIDSSLESRAKRRFEQSLSDETYEQIIESIKKRDNLDKTRKIGPLKIAKDAVIIDNTNTTFQETVKKILNIINEIITKE